jgi:sulfur carrier protein
MKILLNNREEIIDKDSLTISELLSLKKYSFRMRIVKINGNFVPGEDYGKTIINEGDNVQVVYLMSGG